MSRHRRRARGHATYTDIKILTDTKNRFPAIAMKVMPTTCQPVFFFFKIQQRAEAITVLSGSSWPRQVQGCQGWNTQMKVIYLKLHPLMQIIGNGKFQNTDHSILVLIQNLSTRMLVGLSKCGSDPPKWGSLGMSASVSERFKQNWDSTNGQLPFTQRPTRETQMIRQASGTWRLA